MEYNKYFDHTKLSAYATKKDIEVLCNEAYTYHFKSVCVNPCNVSLAKGLLSGSNVLVCTVIGFPLGANTTDVKAYETTRAITDGADEVDMVINVGRVKDKDFDYVYNDILGVVSAAGGVLVKVILETCYLTEEEIIKCSELALKAGADFVKTSTGFGTSGAKAQDVEIMKKTVGEMGVKASGGIKSKDDFLKMVDAGATRIGSSNSVSIIKELLNE